MDFSIVVVYLQVSKLPTATACKSDLQIKSEWAHRHRTPFAQLELHLFQLKLDLASYQQQGLVVGMVWKREAQGWILTLQPWAEVWAHTKPQRSQCSSSSYMQLKSKVPLLLLKRYGLYKPTHQMNILLIGNSQQKLDDQKCLQY